MPFSGNLASPIKGSATLTDAQIAQLEAGKWYVNIHTEANKPGEIRGQLVILVNGSAATVCQRTRVGLGDTIDRTDPHQKLSGQSTIP